ncbi:MAG: hypothetical protein AAF702_13150 [Chloroflexota bacterium]
MNTSLLINARRLGQQQPLVSDTPLSYPPTLQQEAGLIRLRDLISHIVIEEVQAFEQRQSEHRFYQVMTASQIVQGSAKGKIFVETRKEQQSVDCAEAVANALQALQDGLFFFFIDDIQYADLNEELFIKPNSTITLLRLVALAGG